MRVLIYCFGTHGDIQPYIALGRRLIEAGHDAAICTAAGYRTAIESRGVSYAFMNNDMLQIMQQAMPGMRGARDSYKIIRAMSEAQRAALLDQWTAAQDYQPSIIVYHPKSLGGYHIAEKLGVPGVLSLALPFFTPTREFPIPFLKNLPFGGRVNRLSYEFQRFTALVYGAMINDFRRNQLHLPPIRRTSTLLSDSEGRPLTILYAFSRHVRPIPADYPPNVHVTGYWFLDRPDDWQPPAALERFLANGPPPIYIGFGSMGFGKCADRRNKAIIEAIQLAGVRAVFATGWSQSAELDLPQSVLMIEKAPHDWLFPQMRAVVHHGGAGTTGAGLRAGRPTLVCPFLGDQPFWGQQVRLLEAGPDPLPERQITAERLADRLTRLVSNQRYRDRAEAVGRLIRTENGTACATEILESIQPSR
jgi:sterol 3beta-glucosyltransferase